MKPIFLEEMNYLGINKELEGYLWVNARCYYGFNKEYKKVTFGRSLNKLPRTTEGLLTHNEYLEFYYKEITESKVRYEKDKFENYLINNSYEEIIISVSGGKDSTVIHHMVNDICKKYHKTRTLFGNTSNETHHTYKYIKDMYGDELEICNPKEGFYQWVDKTGFVPTRINRVCCDLFKEGNIHEYLETEHNKRVLHICGIRKDESLSRSMYTQVGMGKWKSKQAQDNWNMYLPIIEFDDLDVWSYLFYHNIEFNKLYKFGFGRVGCTNCPFRTNHELELNKYFLPTYSNKWDKLIGDIFERDGLAINLNCTKEEFLKGGWKGGLFRELPTREVIQEFADSKNIEYIKAEKYFKSNKCNVCGKRITKDMIALNMKLLGRETNERMCLKHLAEFQEVDIKILKEDIGNFKKQGCNLF